MLSKILTWVYVKKSSSLQCILSRQLTPSARKRNKKDVSINHKNRVYIQFYTQNCLHEQTFLWYTTSRWWMPADRWVVRHKTKCCSASTIAFIVQLEVIYCILILLESRWSFSTFDTADLNLPTYQAASEIILLYASRCGLFRNRVETQSRIYSCHLLKRGRTYFFFLFIYTLGFLGALTTF